MGRRVRQSEVETGAPAEEPRELDAQAGAGGEDSGRKRRGTAVEEVGRTAVQVTLSEEIAWRLRVVATMERRTPGELVEPLITTYLRGVRLPYDRYSRAGAAIPESQTPVSAN